MLDWSLLGGSPPMIGLTLAGVACLLALLLRRGRTWWVRAVPAAAALTALTLFGLYAALVWWRSRQACSASCSRYCGR
jgi:hypothetical protein